MGAQLPAVLLNNAVAGGTVKAKTKASQMVTTVNGKVPPGRIQAAQVTRLLRVTLESAEVLDQSQTVRAPGTRAPIHKHPYGRSSCVLRSETTIRIEGMPTSRLSSSDDGPGPMTLHPPS